jgi:hypothetical protein
MSDVSANVRQALRQLRGAARNFYADVLPLIIGAFIGLLAALAWGLALMLWGI